MLNKKESTMAHDSLTLAITKIGDLLVSNRITMTKANKPIDNVRLTVPDYQRPYKWTAKNAIQLLDDIIEAKSGNKETYRTGTLILHKETKNGGDFYNIVDGQQRVITFSLLLYALGEENMDFLKQELPDNAYNRRNVPNNMHAFSRRLKVSDDNDHDKKHENELLRDFIKERCEMIVVITDDISEAFQFFDSQNARGKSLYPHDLLKAFHLREMADIDESRTEQIVKEWEENDQNALASLFNEYLYRLKEWLEGDRAQVLNESNINIFKGITKKDRTPYAQFYKAAFAYADMVNRSSMPFVSGTRNLNMFQLDTPIVAGKPFFDYTKHYFSILKDIQDNSKYEGFYINDNEIVRTLDAYYKKGKGNQIARLLFDTAVLLYVDRFCPATYPDKADLEMFDRFVIYAFIWAYSLRAQYYRLSWQSAQNYILTEGARDITNSLNIYKFICRSDSASALLGALADKIHPVPVSKLSQDREKDIDKENCGIFCNYLHFFDIYDLLDK